MQTTKPTHLVTGSEAEFRACEYLTQQGLQLKQANYRCKMGEIDLIMRDNDYYVFIEVRYRRQDSHGDGAASINTHKQQKLIRAAQQYLQTHELTEKVMCRFDVISLDAATTDNKIEWIKDAFWVEW